MTPHQAPMADLARHAHAAAAELKLLANEHRLLLLCRLTQEELSVGQLVGLCGPSQSGVSQNLRRLREGGLVKTRRDRSTIYYSLADDTVRQLIDIVCDRFAALGHPTRRKDASPLRPRLIDGGPG
ncbi:MAG: transcriptional regulator [Caulobacterales bacterium RIFCSPHIGHO2_01_FULL_67_30]|nr:MAG: transcriptional regulator [Caulobacterales bacterium RIFCSPHIGHO2_01_FULL_67_30]